MDGVIILKNIEVHGANSVAGLTWGFPALTQFLGYVHALQRQLPESLHGLLFSGVGVVCHDLQNHTETVNGWGDQGFSLARAPLTKEGATAPINEEGKLNMRVSVLIALDAHALSDGFIDEKQSDLKNYLEVQSAKQRLAGGIVVNSPMCYFTPMSALSSADEDTTQGLNALLRDLLPGFILVSQHEKLREKQMEFRDATNDEPELKAWMYYASRVFRSQENDEEDVTHDQENRENAEKTKKIVWMAEAKKGWLVPLCVGFRAISPVYEAGQVANVRARDVPCVFVENLYSLGEWISPLSITQLDDMFWRYHLNGEEYLCKNTYSNA